MTTLENGLTNHRARDHSAPVVSAQAWCMAGSIHEGRWRRGHVALLNTCCSRHNFRGLQSHRPGMQEGRGYMNAYTSFRSHVITSMCRIQSLGRYHILCDIMRNATLPADEMAKEKDVIVRRWT